jgi:hypothetical protein
MSLPAYAIRTLYFIISQVSVVMIYYAYVHSIMPYRIIFWASSAHSSWLIKIQKRIVRIIMKARNTDSFNHLFRLLNILQFYSQYMFSMSMFVVKNMDIFILNSDIHNIHTRPGSGHLTYKLVKVQKGVFYSGITIFTNLPHNGKNLSSDANSLNTP